MCKQKQVELKFRNKSSLQVLTPLSEYLYKNIFKIFKMTSEQKIVIVGSGLVGKSWAMIFASRGHPVCSSVPRFHFIPSSMCLNGLGSSPGPFYFSRPKGSFVPSITVELLGIKLRVYRPNGRVAIKNQPMPRSKAHL